MLTLEQMVKIAERGGKVRWPDGKVQTLQMVDSHLAGMVIVGTAEGEEPTLLFPQNEYVGEEVIE